jgi:hypothetical protein
VADVTTDDQASAVLAGGRDGAVLPAFASQAPAAANGVGGAAAGLWPAWARPQLESAIELAEAAELGTGLAGLLYRSWFQPVVGEPGEAPDQPLAGLYRAAHAGSGARETADGISVLRRYDAVRPGGWWRTWGEQWVPRSSRNCARLILTPRPDRLAEFVAAVTGRLVDAPVRWSLACALDARRLARTGGAVLDLPSIESVPTDLLADLAPLLRPVRPPLSFPIAPGVGMAEYPGNGMTFGEHRCHLLAVALRHPSSARDPLRAIAAVFAAHGVDPARPYRNR